MIQKLFVDKYNTVHVVCPKCGRKRDKNVSTYLDLALDQAICLKYNCPCGHHLSLLIERRRYIRKNVRLSGQLIFARQKYNMLVLDISRYGLKMKLLGRAKVEKNCKITTEFLLDNKTKSKVFKEAVVRNVSFPTVGAEFLSHNHYDKFGAYILFNFNGL